MGLLSCSVAKEVRTKNDGGRLKTIGSVQVDFRNIANGIDERASRKMSLKILPLNMILVKMKYK